MNEAKNLPHKIRRLKKKLDIALPEERAEIMSLIEDLRRELDILRTPPPEIRDILDDEHVENAVIEAFEDMRTLSGSAVAAYLSAVERYIELRPEENNVKGRARAVDIVLKQRCDMVKIVESGGLV
jgi:hypothetical protein